MSKYDNQKENVFIGIDLALRKSGVVVLDDNGNLKSLEVIDSTNKKLKDEDLLLNNKLAIKNLLEELSSKYTIKCIFLEGLSYNSVSSSKDLIGANYWLSMIEMKILDIKYVVIPPKSWQKIIATKEKLLPIVEKFPIKRANKKEKLTKEEVKLNTKHKAETRKELKNLILNSIPENIRIQITEYIENNKKVEDFKYDLADAYFITKLSMSKYV